MSKGLSNLMCWNRNSRFQIQEPRYLSTQSYIHFLPRVFPTRDEHHHLIGYQTEHWGDALDSAPHSMPGELFPLRPTTFPMVPCPTRYLSRTFRSQELPAFLSLQTFFFCISWWTISFNNLSLCSNSKELPKATFPASTWPCSSPYPTF